jgi:hypothetical protein
MPCAALVCRVVSGTSRHRVAASMRLLKKRNQRTRALAWHRQAKSSLARERSVIADTAGPARLNAQGDFGFDQLPTASAIARRRQLGARAWRNLR